MLLHWTKHNQTFLSTTSHLPVVFDDEPPPFTSSKDNQTQVANTKHKDAPVPTTSGSSTLEGLSPLPKSEVKK